MGALKEEEKRSRVVPCDGSDHWGRDLLSIAVRNHEISPKVTEYGPEHSSDVSHKNDNPSNVAVICNFGDFRFCLVDQHHHSEPLDSVGSELSAYHRHRDIGVQLSQFRSWYLRSSEAEIALSNIELSTHVHPVSWRVVQQCHTLHACENNILRSFDPCKDEVD